MPSVLWLHIVMCVYAPEPETSSLFCSGVPHATRDLSLRWVPGVTYASSPMIGLTPAAFAAFEFYNAAKVLP